MKADFKKKGFRIKKSIKTLINDLVTLPYSIKILMLILIALIILNNFFDLNYFIDSTNHPSIWTFKNNNLKRWKELFLLLSSLATISHIICNFLLAYDRISNFFWGIIGVSSYGLYTIAWGYLGDMQLNLFFFLPMQFVGYNLWKKNLDNNKTVIVHQFSWTETLISIYALIIISTFFYFEIPAYSKFVVGSYAYEGNTIKNIIPHLFDASTNALSIVGQILMLLRYREHWIMWMLSNILQLAMFSGIANGRVDVNMMILWTFAIINASIGLKKWFFDIAKKETIPNFKNDLNQKVFKK